MYGPCRNRTYNLLVAAGRSIYSRGTLPAPAESREIAASAPPNTRRCPREGATKVQPAFSARDAARAGLYACLAHWLVLAIAFGFVIGLEVE